MDLTLPSTCPRGSDIRTVWAWSVCWLRSASDEVAGSLLQCIPYCLRGHISIQSPQKDILFMCPWATDQTKAGEVVGTTVIEHPADSNGNARETHAQKMQGQFMYGMKNLLAKMEFAVPALLNYLWQVSLFASSLCVLSEWSPWVLPISVTSWEKTTPLLLQSHLWALGKEKVFIPYWRLIILYF